MGSQWQTIAAMPALLLGALHMVLISMNGLGVDAQAWASTEWTPAHATYYGGTDASGTMGGSCGYGNLYSTGYDLTTAALSVALFNNGLSCGACFQLVCVIPGSMYCYNSGASITVTATNLCPDGSYGGWCNHPNLHFDLSYPMFTKLAQAVGGVIPVMYRRVPCSKTGGIVFQINGNPYWFLVLVTNVNNGGDVAGMQIKGDNSGFYGMTQNWGQNWQSVSPQLVGQPLSFQCTLGNGAWKIFSHVAPSYWGFGQSYKSNSNF